ncbi:MAG: 4Fe-4S cluster-binding domain-containing protein [Candidatus Aureabacteria bacterium]|nr:4Fe-4S cluster-binding domain-containing protein [Candidatus Auribacterota bacterium]
MFEDYYSNLLHHCALCPRQCHADRFSSKLGYCNTGAVFPVSSICLHHGEEPVISGKRGICNIFFSHCNLQCRYCQNYQISSNVIGVGPIVLELEEIITQLEVHLKNKITRIGFVSPSHVLPQVEIIMKRLRERNWNPVFVYNTNGYDRSEQIRSLEGRIQVYLPDLKYTDGSVSKAYSDAADYPFYAKEAIKEMFRQKGSEIILDEQGEILSGLIIRHLVIPGQVENSIACLRFIAEELSPDVSVSLMSQYHPVPATIKHRCLGRTLNKEEYAQVRHELEKLGMQNGWIQELESSAYYFPDFNRPHPFEEKNHHGGRGEHGE